MPNIIEQQDLLKGLPDARLATLMQTPTADIPPFLVAAEAQRRQSIRQQFSGGTNESVVDTLTKQMANVPQNVQASPQTPPQLPPPQMQPQMAGIGALPQPQQMANGGMVQRYQEGGKIQPMWSLPSYSGSIPKVMDWVGGKAADLYEYATTPYSAQNPAADVAEEVISPGAGILDIQYPDVKIVKGRSPLPDAPKTEKLRDETAGTTDSSIENKYRAQEAALRDRLAALYGGDEPSNWEEAQKWFAMSQQIMNPDANLLQGLVNAGGVYAQAEGEQARAQRESDRELQKALLSWDMEAMQAERAAQAAAAEKESDRDWEIEKRGYASADNVITSLSRQIDDKQKDIDDQVDLAKKEALIKQRQALEIRLSDILSKSGFGPADMPTRDDIDAQASPSFAR